MRLIVCEKQVAAKRIAEILSDGKCVTEKKFNLPYYVFPGNLVVGLSGHVLRVDFPSKLSSWTDVNLRDLVNANLVYAHDKNEIINLVKFLVKDSSELIIATDFDTEGESIGLEAVNISFEVKKLPVKRMHFSSITVDEIKDSINNLTGLDFNLAYAADSRREIDLVWGAVLTRFLSVASHRLGDSFLSVGRVQTPTLALIVERELERLKFKPVPYWEFPLTLIKDKVDFVAYYVERKVFDVKLRDELKSLKPDFAVVKNVKVKESIVKPPEPFNTTSFLREAASLGFSGVNAMRVAESLYLKGLVSYPRTDNQVYPSSINAKKIIESFRKTKYASLLSFLNSSLTPTKGATESKDHPPIHPTGLMPEGIEPSEEKIYDLIVRRFIATFCNDCVEELTKVDFDVKGYVFVSDGYHVLSPGWRAVYVFSERKENVLPSLVEGESLKVKGFDCVSKETQPPDRYGHGSIIKVMSDLNLGTKSTRPTIVQKLIDRFYLFSSKSLAPTPVAMAVINALNKHADIITESSMTEELEKDMDDVSSGKLSKEVVVNESRKMLLKVLSVLEKNSEGISSSIREGISASYNVGPCPKCGNEMIIRTARASGKRFVGCSSYPKCNNGYPLPQTGFLQVTLDFCKSCGLRKIIRVAKGKRPLFFCPNLDCPSRKDKPDFKKGVKKIKSKK